MLESHQRLLMPGTCIRVSAVRDHAAGNTLPRQISSKALTGAGRVISACRKSGWHWHAATVKVGTPIYCC